MRFVLLGYVLMTWSLFAHSQSSSFAQKTTDNSWFDPVHKLTWVYIGEHAFETAKRECVSKGYGFPYFNGMNSSSPIVQSLSKVLQESPLIELIPEMAPDTRDTIFGAQVTRRSWIDNPAMMEWYSFWYRYRDVQDAGYPDPTQMSAYVFVGPINSGQSIWLQIVKMPTLCLKYSN